MRHEWDLPEIGLRRQSAADRELYWQRYAAARPEVTYLRGNTYSRWRAVPATEVVLSLYITNHSTGVFVRGARGEPYATTLARLGDELVQKIAAALNVAEMNGGGFPLVRAYRFAATDTAAWPDAQAWLRQQEDDYLDVLTRIVAGAESGTGISGNHTARPVSR